MTGLGIQAWVLPAIGIRLEMLEFLHVLGNSYRLASSGVGPGMVYGRFTVCFCRTVVAGTLCNLASRSAVLHALVHLS